jgi:hypothetical protein
VLGIAILLPIFIAAITISMTIGTNVTLPTDEAVLIGGVLVLIMTLLAIAGVPAAWVFSSVLASRSHARTAVFIDTVVDHLNGEQAVADEALGLPLPMEEQRPSPAAVDFAGPTRGRTQS